MELTQACTRCGGSNLEQGDLTTARGKVHLRLLNAPFFSLFSPNINIQATMCLDCGDIKLTGDATRAREILKK